MALAALDPGLHRWSPAHFGSHRELMLRIQDRSRQHAACVCCSEIGTAPESASFVEPGQLFVIQNAGACVSVDRALIPSVEYALGLLGIEHLIVCGHLECRLVAGALAAPRTRPITALELRLAADLAPVVQRYGDRRAESLPALLAQEQVLLQLRALIDSRLAGGRLAQGPLQLYGWLIDDRTAQVFGFNVESGQFEPLRFNPTR
jgi:carbonic anhydrase